MLFLGCTSDFTTETDRIFLKAFPWELKKKNNVEILLPPLCCQGSTAAAPGQSSRGTQPHGSGFFSKRQEIPSTREMCRSFTSNETRRAWKRSTKTLCSKTKHRCRAGLQKMQLSNKVLQLLPELPGGSSGAEAAAKPQDREFPLLPSTQLGHEGSSDLHHHFFTLLGGIHWAVAFKWEGQKCRSGTFCYSEIPAKPPAATAVSIALFVEHLSCCWTCTLKSYSFYMVISWT